MQSASAAFTPTFQATLPDILPNEAQYTRALSYSQLASTLETLLSPLLAAVLISVVDFHWLFVVTAGGFLASASLVVSSRIPDTANPTPGRPLERVLRGARVFVATPRLRGLMGLNLVVAAGGSIVMVNTVNLVQEHLGRPDADVAWLLSANGAGILVVALTIPRLLRHHGDRTVMTAGATIITIAVLGAVAFSVGRSGEWQWPALIALWGMIGMGSGAILTPTGNVIRRSSSPADRTSLFAAQFSLSHACWLLAYPIAGWVATSTDYATTWTILAGLATAGAILARRAWPAHETTHIAHLHPADIADPSHVGDADPTEHGYAHTHEMVIDQLHRHWPTERRPAVA